MSSFAFQPIFELGHDDDTPYRKLAGEFVSTAKFGDQRVLTIEPEALTRLAAAGRARRLAPLPARPPRAAAQHPRRPRGLRQRPLRRAADAEERQRLGGHGAAVVPGHRHRDRDRQEGPARRGRTATTRKRSRAASIDTYTDDEPALLADGAADDVRGDEHRHATCRRRSSSTPSRATSTTSSSSPRAAARPTRPSSSRRPRRC